MNDTTVEVRVGSLDDAPFNLRPEAEIWIKRVATPGRPQDLGVIVAMCRPRPRPSRS
jgi:hypothetical protein